jgi:hypothetical protein
MPFVSSRAQLSLAPEEEAWLRPLSQSRSESVARVQRAQILLRFAHGETVSAIAAGLDTNRPKVERCIAKALQLGVLAALQDLLRRGRRARLSEEDKAWWSTFRAYRVPGPITRPHGHFISCTQSAPFRD